MKPYCLLLAPIVWLANPLWAQVDIESLRRDDQAGFFGSVAIDLTLRAGNEESALADWERIARFSHSIGRPTAAHIKALARGKGRFVRY